jgi:purine-binding chemotaxis protein CheW
MTARASLDWAEAHRRLEAVRHALEHGPQSAPEETARVLEARARALARVPEPVIAPAARDVMLLSLAGEWHALGVERVLEALPLAQLTPVPGTPPFVLGVTSRRGIALAVIDVSRVLGLAGADPRQLVVVEAAEMTFGIAVDAVEGPLPRGADERLVADLDLDALVADGRLTIEEDR